MAPSLAAESAVLSTPELLEQIMVQLPIRDLLTTAPLVCKSWFSTTRSPTLQRALFFEPDPSASTSARIQNPLLAQLFPLFFSHGTKYHGTDSIMDMPWAQAPDAFRRRDASWRRMLVAQPTLRALGVHYSTSGMIGMSERQGVINDLSLSMGTLYDLAVQLVDDDSTSFRVLWEADRLTLAVSAGGSCTDEFEKNLGEQFRSEGETLVDVPFGEWETHLWD
ncbi:putative MFS transporter [Favolaschia claudopus]|uniref:MFS transporter n=1 Tax=Favolaschia claudopus TaxID=2862362 RepID=A0AAW0DBA6_9AGAR